MFCVVCFVLLFVCVGVFAFKKLICMSCMLCMLFFAYDFVCLCVVWFVLLFGCYVVLLVFVLTMSCMLCMFVTFCV